MRVGVLWLTSLALWWAFFAILVVLSGCTPLFPTGTWREPRCLIVRGDPGVDVAPVYQAADEWNAVCGRPMLSRCATEKGAALFIVHGRDKVDPVTRRCGETFISGAGEIYTSCGSLLAVARHELGHALGIAPHTPGTVMSEVVAPTSAPFLPRASLVGIGWACP